MRLPWIQLTEDGERRARSFGQLVGVGADAGVGFVTRLWRAALDLAPPGDFTGRFEDPPLLVAHAGGNPPGCTAEPARVVELLHKVGLCAAIPSLRVRGLDRYEPTWRKNNKVPKQLDHPPGFPAETAPEPARKTETETETEIKSARAAKSLDRATTPPGDDFYIWFQDNREARGLVREEPTQDPARFPAFAASLTDLWRRMMEKLGGDPERARAAALVYIAETVGKGAPWLWFARQWERYAGKRYGQAPASGAAASAADTDWSNYKVGDIYRDLGIDPATRDEFGMPIEPEAKTK